MPPKHVVPTIQGKSFSCPRCGALADQTWYITYVDRIREDEPLPTIRTEMDVRFFKDQVAKAQSNEERAALTRWVPYVERQALGEPFLGDSARNKSPDYVLENIHISQCFSCKKASIWVYDNVLYPVSRHEIEPNSDMSPDIIAVFEEARLVFADSPRAAAALLRLCVQMLCKQLGQPGENLNADIGALVKINLPSTIQKALDLVRVIGNNAVHPGTINLNDDRATAAKLFELVNLIADNQITQPAAIEALFEEKIPETAKEQIARRDSKPS